MLVSKGRRGERLDLKRPRATLSQEQFKLSEGLHLGSLASLLVGSQRIAPMPLKYILHGELQNPIGRIRGRTVGGARRRRGIRGDHAERAGADGESGISRPKAIRDVEHLKSSDQCLTLTNPELS